jgi:hypothetical protein
MTIESFLSSQRVSENKFRGVYKKQSDTHGYINDIISADEGKFLIHPDTGRRMGIGVPTNVMKLEDGAYYQFSIMLAPDQFRAKVGDNFYLFIDRRRGCEKLELNPYQQIIKQRFERLDNPDANLIIASLLREVGKGLYSSKKRMFFELLQNADDVPTSSGNVRFYLETKGDYLVLMHDGLPFDKDDVESITSAAESTKQKRQDKTGYKGIGFKSVFTDSEEVIIKSGGFNFKFDRHHPRYQNFEKFYFDRQRYIEYPKLLAEDKTKFESAAKKFQGVASIPWQLLPLWADTLPKDLSESDFTKNNNVGIGLKIGAKGLRDYENEIKELFYDGRFLLFLRNTSLVQFSNYDLKVRKYREENIVKLRIDFQDPEPSNFLTYSTTGYEVPVDEELIDQLELDLVRHEEDDPIESGAKRYYFTNRDGKKLETIPPKVAAFKTANLSFAAPVIEGKVNEEPSFKKKERFSYFYTYLPMRENRLRLPFLVNADFIPSSNREELQGDNPWNHLLMGLIGKKMVEWIADLALQNEPNYLNLLLEEEMKAEDNDVAELVEHFNKAYLNTIEEIAFIKSEDGELQTQSDTVLDLIGLTKIIPTALYHEITCTGKKLPARDINTDILRKKVFSGITKVGYEELLDALADENKRLALRKWLINVPSETLQQFLEWVEKSLIPSCEKFELTDKLLPILRELNLFRFDRDLLAKVQSMNISVSSWLQEAETLRISSANINFVNEKPEFGLLIQEKWLSSNIEVFEKTGFKISSDFSIYPRILDAVLLDSSLNKSDELLYNKIKSFSQDKNYTVYEATRLLTIIKSIGGGYFDKALKELPLFTTGEGVRLPLNAIIHQEVPKHHSAFSRFYLSEADWKILQATTLADATITYDRVLEALVCNPKYLNILKGNLGAGDLSSFYHALCKYLKESELDSLPGHNLEIICTSSCDDLSFASPNQVLYNDALKGLSRTEFEEVKELLESCSNYILNLPVYEALEFIELAEFNCKDESVISHLHKNLEVPSSSVNALIKYLKTSPHKEPLFDRVLLMEVEDSGILIIVNKAKCSFQVRAGRELLDYVLSKRGYVSKVFPLPNSIEDKALKDLKLMYEPELLDYFLKSNAFDCEFVQFIEDKEEARQYNFLTGLTGIPLSTSDTSANIFPVRALNLIKTLLHKEELTENETELLNHVRAIITIDGKSREQYNTAQDIDFKSNSDRGKWYKFKLSKLIKTEDEGISIDKIKSIFPKWSYKELEKLFEPHRISLSSIQEILKNGNSYSGYQLAFTVCHFDAGSSRANELSFTSGTFSSGFTSEFLDEVKRQKAVHFLPLLKCLQVANPTSIVLDAELRLNGTSEEPPQWLEAWAYQQEENQEFLYNSGLKRSNSDLLNLRRQFLNNKFTDEWKSLIHSKEISVAEHNRTIEWLFKYFKTVTLEQAKASVELYESMLGRTGAAIGHVLQEARGEDGARYFSFSNSALHYIPASLPVEEVEKIHAIASKKQTPLIPSFYSEALMKALSKKPIIVERGVLDPKSIADAQIWSNSFYQNWAHKDIYKIFTTDSIFRRVDIVLGETINSYIVEENVIIHEGVYYTTLDDDQEIALSLALPNSSHALELVKGIISFRAGNKRQNEEDVDAPDYAAEYEEVIRDFKDLDKDVQMSKNKEALQKGIIHLTYCGFEISQASLRANALIDVIKDGIEYTFFFHSSKGGLLFITPGILKSLYEPFTGVVVLYPKGKTRHFIGVDELLENPENSYFLLRAENNRDKEMLKGIIQASESYNSHFMFVTSNEMREKLFDLSDKRKKNGSLGDRAIIDPSDF